MPLKQITFSKKYPYAQFLNYDIGYVWELSYGETNEEIEEKLLQMAENHHRTHHPHLYQEQDTIQHTHIASQWEDKYHTQQQPTVTTNSTEKISPEQEIEDTLKGIEEATAETLPTFRIKASQNIKTLGAYNRRKKQLNIN